ncbi:NmrA-like family domain-containing protein [Cladobotryum mycophilum]|uniref:NmrA-like family domain-containing protein n=1 Tax=Cladobotryum mycophilum TaxID=491253 RepID=A0ABR0SLK7_9HYPO
MAATKIILILGGAGAQNSAVTQELVKNESFAIRLLSRDATSEQCKQLAVLPRVHLIEGDCYDEDTLVSAFKGVDAVFVNTNGFAIGEKAEIFWGIRMYEIAYWAGVKHFVYSSLPYVSKKSGFDPTYRVPFVDGKAKVVEYLRAQPTDKMNWSVIETGPYAEAHLGNSWFPSKGPDGVYVFRMAIGPTGAFAIQSLAEIGWFTRYIFEHPQEFEGDLLGVGIEHVMGDRIASAFTNVTGLAARFEPMDIPALMNTWPDKKIGLSGSPGYDDPTLKTRREMFAPWFRIWTESGGNTGLWTKDYERLDRIYPGRMKSIEEWMRSVGYSAEKLPDVLRTGLN